LFNIDLMKENLMNAQVNGSALDPRDVHVPSLEPMVASASMPRAAAELEDTVDDNRKDQVNASAPALALYLAEKYFWKTSAGGKPYLSPLPTFLAYVAGAKAEYKDGKVVKPATNGAAARAADYGLGLIYPQGEHGVTDESTLVDQLVE
jgi:hypothetical protein